MKDFIVKNTEKYNIARKEYIDVSENLLNWKNIL